MITDNQVVKDASNLEDQGEDTMKAERFIKKFTVVVGILAAVAVSMAFPYGLGLIAIVWALAIAGAVVGTGIICFKLGKELLGGTASFSYSPNMAYLTGKKGGKVKREKDENLEKKED